MKRKIIATLAAVLLLCTLSACSSDNPVGSFVSDTPNASDTSDTPQSTSTPEPEPNDAEVVLSVGETGVLLDYEISLDSWEVTDAVSAAYGSFTPDEGSHYVVVYLTIKNTGKDSSVLIPTYGYGNDYARAKILYQAEYEYSSTNLLGHSDELHDVMCNPLESKSGLLAFSLPNEAADSGELTFTLTAGRDTLTYKLN